MDLSPAYRMTITKEMIEEFKALMLKERGIALTDQEAADGARSLLGLFETLLRIKNRVGDSELNSQTNQPTIGFGPEKH